MSHYHFKKYIDIRSYTIGKDIPFEARLFYLMEKADSEKLALLEIAFPGKYAEFKVRFNAPNNKIEGD